MDIPNIVEDIILLIFNIFLSFFVILHLKISFINRNQR